MVDIHQVDHPSELVVRASYPPMNSSRIHMLSMTVSQGQLPQAGVAASFFKSAVVNPVVGALRLEVRTAKWA
jgi:hypothetical protein